MKKTSAIETGIHAPANKNKANTSELNYKTSLLVSVGTDRRVFNEKNMKKLVKKTALTQTIEVYASRSSIHGISYVFDREINVDVNDDFDDDEGV